MLFEASGAIISTCLLPLSPRKAEIGLLTAFNRRQVTTRFIYLRDSLHISSNGGLFFQE